MEKTKKVDSDTVRVDLGKEALAILGCKLGDWIGIRSEGNKIVIAKAEVKIPVVIVMMLLVVGSFSMPVYAQEAPMEQEVSPSPTLPATPDPLRTVPTKVFHGPTAWLPLRIELTYPSTTSLIQNVTKSPLTVTNINTLDGVNGLATTTFTTGMSDSFDILLGARYSTPQDQIALLKVYSNSTIVFEDFLPISGTEFSVRIRAVTTEAPKPPTPDQINAPILAALGEMHQDQTSHDSEVHETNRVVGLAANGFSFSIIPSFGSMVFNAMLAAGMLYLVMRNRGFKKNAVVTVRNKEAAQ